MKYLVLGPAVMGVYAVLGALKALEKQMADLEEISCSSSGALISFFLLLGHAPDEILHIFSRVPIKELTKPNLKNITKTWGFIPHEHIKKFLSDFYNGTFQTLHDTNKIKMHVSSYCVNTNKTVYFSVDSHPHMNVVDAICASISVPLMFQPAKMDGLIYMDGGCFERIPGAPFVGKSQSDIVSIKIDKAVHSPGTFEIKTMGQFLLKGLHSLVYNAAAVDVFDNTISIYLPDVNIFDLKMSETDTLKLFTRGHQAALTHSGLVM